MEQITNYKKGIVMYKVISLLILFLFLTYSINGQVVENTKEKIKDKTKDRVENGIDSGIDKGLDKIEKGIMGLFGGDEEEEAEEEESYQENDDAEIDEEAEYEDEGRGSKKGNAVKEDLKTYSKYDFIPGDEVIFFDDFSDVDLGEFPLKWNTTASGEIVNTNRAEGKWFKMLEDYSNYSPELTTPYPENFTIEFDVIYPDNVEWWLDFYVNTSGYIDNGYLPGDGGFQLVFEGENVMVKNYDNGDPGEFRELGSSQGKEIEPGEIVRYSIWGQKERLRLYVNEKKVIDMPRAIPRRFDINYMRFGCITEMMISNFRFAVGAPDTRSRLITDGILVTRGITFDSGSDRIKAESYGVLKDIASVLKENKDVRVNIVGHTDSDGADDFNMSLSKKRSDAVKNALESQFGIPGSRMETDGKGESKPVSPNDTSEGKANNRRVEFIKL